MSSPQLSTEVRAMVASSLELSPRVLATDANLETLLQHITCEECLLLDTHDGSPTICLKVNVPKKKERLFLAIRSPCYANEREGHRRDSYVTLTHSEYPLTTDGLLNLISDGKNRRADYMKRGCSPDCSTEEPPHKKLKATGCPGAVTAPSDPRSDCQRGGADQQERGGKRGGRDRQERGGQHANGIIRKSIHSARKTHLCFFGGAERAKLEFICGRCGCGFEGGVLNELCSWNSICL